MNKKIPVILSSAVILSATPFVFANTNYVDGSYSAEGSYSTPEGLENVNLSVKLLNNNITDATFTVNTNNSTSKYFDNLFINGFKTEVIGKNIDDVKLTIVNGASLTPIGFNDALSKIKQQALQKTESTTTSTTNTNTSTTNTTSTTSTTPTTTETSNTISKNTQKRLDNLKKIQDKQLSEIDKQIKKLQDRKAKIIKEYDNNVKKIKDNEIKKNLEIKQKIKKETEVKEHENENERD